MVLDEEALEAMLARGRAADQGGPAPEMVVADESDDFEVYERKEERPSAAPAPTEETPPAPAADFEVYGEDLVPPQPGLPTPSSHPSEQPLPPPREPTPDVAPEPARPADSPRPAPAGPQAATVEAAAPATTQISAPEAHPARRRPEVWPPIRRSHAPTGHATASQAAAQPPPPASPTRSDGKARIAIVQALFNHEITDRMVHSATQAATSLGVQVTQTVQVAGIYDMPLAAKRLLARPDVDGLVVLGVVIQGETRHDEVITHATAKTLQELSLQADKPIGLGITGPGMTWQQAEARIDNAAHAVQAVVGLLRATI